MKNFFFDNKIGRIMRLSFLFIGITFLFSCSYNKQYGCLCYASTSRGLAETVLTVSPTNIEGFHSSDDDPLGGPVRADGGCHANMYLSFRWVDDELAKSNERPPIAYEFQTLFGYFPTNLGMETISTSSSGINTYNIKVTKAADASKPEPNRYGIWVKYLKDIASQDGAVQCSIDIDYNIYNESVHIEGCD